MLSQINPVHITPSYLSKTQFKIPSHLVLLVVSFLLGFPQKSYMHSASPPFVLHALPISSFLTWSFELCLAKSTRNEGMKLLIMQLPTNSYHVIPLRPKNSLQHRAVKYSQLYILQLLSETKFQTHKNYRQNHSSVYYKIFICRQ
jgi:hypothetical protein